MSWDDIVMEGTPVSLGWFCVTTTFWTPVLCGGNIFMTVLFQALQRTAEILNYYGCVGGMFIFPEIPIPNKFQKELNHVEI